MAKALSSLKYFYENAPQYHIVCAGSLLGIALHSGTSFPVGKVDFLKLYPLSFQEFLMATGKERFAKLLSQRDFSKHAPNEIVPRIRMIWNSIPSQLAKENKKFIYGMVREGARAKDYETAIMWLSDCGLVHKVSRVNTPNLPLKAYEDLKAFKLFLVDVGLLGCMMGLRQRTLVEGNDLFVEFKGALTEQYVLQQLVTLSNLNIYYYTNDRGSCEIDFLIDDGEMVVPVEVKAEENLRAKSLRTYKEKYQPEISVRTSMADYRKEEWLVNLPLYAVEEIMQ